MPASDDRKADTNIKVFKLIERYNHHKDVAVHMFEKIKFYNKYKIREIFNFFSERSNDGRELLKLLFYEEENCDINRTSLGKLKKDLLKRYR